MFEAVKRSFPFVNEGKIQKLSPAERTTLDEQCIRIGVKRSAHVNSKYPTYVVVDSGGGQLPTLFVFEGGYAVSEVGVNTANVLTGFESA